jgi:hypothetical protein
LVKSVLGFLEDDLGFGLLSKSSLDLSGESVSIDVFSLKVGLEP